MLIVLPPEKTRTLYTHTHAQQQPSIMFPFLLLSITKDNDKDARQKTKETHPQHRRLNLFSDGLHGWPVGLVALAHGLHREVLDNGTRVEREFRKTRSIPCSVRVVVVLLRLVIHVAVATATVLGIALLRVVAVRHCGRSEMGRRRRKGRGEEG